MSSFFADIASGFASGTAIGTSTAFFDLTAILFLVSTAAYVTYMGWRRERVWLTGFVFAILGTAALTVALALRWVAAGWDHPPFTNLYESLVFFAWGIAVFYLVVESRYHVKAAGALVIPIAFLAMGMAALSPEKGLVPLMPALQDIWLHLHVFSASIGYAAFLVAFGFSVLFLVKDALPVRQFGLASSVFTLLAALAVTKGKVLFLQFDMTRTVRMGDGAVRAATMPGGAETTVTVPFAGMILGIACLILLAAGVLLATASGEAEDHRTRWGYNLFFGGSFVFTIFLLDVFLFVSGNPDVSLRVDVYGIAFLISAWLVGAIALIVYLRHDRLADALPAARKLDELAYKSIMVAFPIMTFVIVSGAVWANQAWGRYWGWDPKETASLITWGIYLLYLHARFTRGWTGRRAALISIIGFISVVFTYLGVNLVLSGLHSYASG